MKTSVLRIISLLAICMGGLLSTLSWYKGVSFANPYADQAVIISLMLALVFMSREITIKGNFFKGGKLFSYVCLLILIFIFWRWGYTPSLFYGNRIALKEVHVGNYIVREKEYLYGFMDRGSLFEVSRRLDRFSGIEELIGYVYSTNRFWGDTPYLIRVNPNANRFFIRGVSEEKEYDFTIRKCPP